jgi:hypothetical protein
MSFFGRDPPNDSNPKPGLAFTNREALIGNPRIEHLYSNGWRKRSQRLRHKTGGRNNVNALGQKTIANDEAGVGFVEVAVSVIHNRTAQ